MEQLPNSKAYSQFQIKAVDEGKRQIRGIASTPSPDRVQDVILPEGAVFTLPIPLLWQHDHQQPIGNVIEAKVTAKGIEILAELVSVAAPSQLAARLEEAWQSIKTGLVRGLSIGFSPIKYSFLETGGVEFSQYGWHELSVVTIPCNMEATITTIKSLSQQQAASGKPAAKVVKMLQNVGVPAQKTTPITPPEGQAMFNQEAIDGFKATLEAKKKELATLVTKSTVAGVTLDASEEESYETLVGEISTLEKHIERLETVQKMNITTAKPVDATPSVKTVATNRQGSQAPAVVHTTKNEEQGIGFVKFALSMFAGKGDVSSAKAFAESHFANDVRLQNIMKSAVAAGTTTSAQWAGNLVDYRNLSSEFIEFLRPRTIVGQFGLDGKPSLRRVPFNVRIPGKTAAGSASWVGEGYRKPVTSSGYEAVELKWSKIAAISVITDELARFSDPSIQTLVRDDLAEAVIERMDIDFINPAKGAGTGAGLSPASVTNGVTAIPSSGNDADSIRADIAELWAVADDTNLPTASAVYITDSRTARRLSMLRNPLGQMEFPGVGVNGGTIDGVPVIVSNYVPSDSNGSLFVLAFASEIYLADDGVVTIDISREASIFMDDAAATGTPTAAQLVSMFQTNQQAIRAERYVHWKKRRSQAVAYLSGVNWGPNAA